MKMVYNQHAMQDRKDCFKGGKQKMAKGGSYGKSAGYPGPKVMATKYDRPKDY